MNLEIKHLAPYLPYGLKLKTEYGWCIMLTLNDWSVNGDCDESLCYETKDTTDFKPILRPLSDLTKVDIKEFYQCSDIDMGIMDWQEWAEELCHLLKNDNPFQLRQFEYLYKRNFDVFGLIENNLAIDINTLK